MKYIRIIRHIVVFVLLYLFFSASFFLGLQVNPMFGNIGFVVSAILALLYLYWSFRKKKLK